MDMPRAMTLVFCEWEIDVARRHHLDPHNWESVFRRLEELVLANSGEDEFQEIYKILLAKLFAELNPKAPAFEVLSTAGETAQRVNELLALAAARWPGILDELESRLTANHIEVCVEAMAGFSITDSTLEVLDALFEYLISRSAKGAKGQYFTPRHVVECCVRIMEPHASETIVDPACGSGGFLMHALQVVQRRNPGLDPRTYSSAHLWGFDFDPRAVQVAKALMLVAGDGASNIYRLNSLLSQRAAESSLLPDHYPDASLTIEDVVRSRTRKFVGFDVVLTNPPFAGEVREEHLLDAYSLRRPRGRNERDVLFLERCLDLLRPGGRLAIVLPHNKFGAKGFAYVREWLLPRAQVVAVVGLHRSTFQPHTAQKASVLFARKRERRKQAPHAEKVFFAVSEKAGKDGRGMEMVRAGSGTEAPAWDRLDHDLDEVVEAFHEHVEAHGIEWSRHG